MMHPMLWFSMAFLPFTALLMLVVLLALMETLHLYFRTSPAQCFHSLLPAVQQRLLQKLDAVNLPFFDISLIWLIGVASSGILLQLLCNYVLEHPVSPLCLVIPALIMSTIATRLLSHWLTQLQMPPLPTTDNALLLGRLATIYSGNAKPGLSALAYVRDQFGQLHEVPVEPEFGELTLHDEVILFGMREHIYLAKPVLTTPTDA